MVKLDKNSVVGMSSLMIFCVFAVMNVQGGVLKYVLFGFLHLILSTATFLCMTHVMEKSDRNIKASSAYWFDLAPFAIVLVLATLVAGWDFYIIFYFIGMVYVVLNETFYRLNRGLKFKDFDLYKPIAVGIGSIVLYVVLSFAGGSPV